MENSAAEILLYSWDFVNECYDLARLLQACGEKLDIDMSNGGF
jgi:hypothetical protein